MNMKANLSLYKKKRKMETSQIES